MTYAWQNRLHITLYPSLSSYFGGHWYIGYMGEDWFTLYFPFDISHIFGKVHVWKNLRQKNWMKFIGIVTEVSDWWFVKAIYLYFPSSGNHICVFSVNFTLFPDWDFSGT